MSNELEIQKIVSQAFMAMNKEDQRKLVRNYKALNAVAKKGQIVFTGSSLMQQFPIQELALSLDLPLKVYNRGIGGYTTDDFLREIDTMLLDLEPSKFFINIGTNDMTDRVYGDKWMDHLFENYESIISQARQKLPEAEIYMMAYYPTNHHLPNAEDWAKDMLKQRSIENITACNEKVAKLAEKYGCHYIDCNQGLCDERGEQKAEFAVDGVHMYAEAYKIVFDNLKQYL